SVISYVPLPLVRTSNCSWWIRIRFADVKITRTKNSRALIFAVAGELMNRRCKAIWNVFMFDEPTIQRRLDTIAAQISNDYRNRDLTVIAILNGSLIFMADLLRRVPLPLRLDCLGVASYHGKAQTSGDVIFKQVAMPD